MKLQDYGNLILASGSARRKEILENHGLSPVVRPMDVDETLPAGISARDAVMYLALKKGLAAESEFHNDPDSFGSTTPGTDTLIISSDTVVYARDITNGSWTIMGKPKDENDARRMLTSIRGTYHYVLSGVSLIEPGEPDAAGEERDKGSVNTVDRSDSRSGIRRVFAAATKVFVDDVTDADLDEYIASGEPFGKAGGYAIQLAFGKYVDHIEGDYENVVGLPFPDIEKELAAL